MARTASGTRRSRRALPHPAYPASEARPGFSDADALHYAPEFGPEFTLCWVAVPRSRLTVAGQADAWPAGWPALPAVGLPAALAATHDLLPVHPVTARDRLAPALAEAGLSGPGDEAERAVIAPGTALRVTPTLSMRTVALASQPDAHLKLPLPTSTLGLLNRRSIGQGTLVDGALVRGILTAACRADALLDGLLLADESSYAHAGHPFLGYLLRRLPAGLDRYRVAPVAALAATSADAGAARPPARHRRAGRLGGPRRPGRPVRGVPAAALRPAGAPVRQVRHRPGVAPAERRRRSVAARCERPATRLIVKDFDGALLHLPRLTAALGPDAPAAGAFADPRLLTTSDDALADVFITITVHLCAGALAFGLARQGVAPLPDLLALTRRELTAALDRDAGSPAAALLRARVLDADRLPGKSMVTAGTLVAKSRTGASDINKFYGTNGPNYLKDDSMRSCR